MKYLFTALLLFLASPVFAQDMPLSMFLLDGETWAKVDDSLEPLAEPPRDVAGHRTGVVTLSPDGGTLFAEHPGGKAVWAYRVGKGGELSSGEPYCPLRRRIGQEQVAVTGLTTDTAGRTGPIRWAGEKKDMLAVEVGDAWYVRKMNATGTR